MKVHSGSAQAKTATALGRVALSSGAAEKKDATRFGVEGDEEGDQGGGKDGGEQGGLDGAVRRVLVAGRDDPLKRAGQRQVDDILGEVDRRPQSDVNAVGRQPVEPDEQRLRHHLDEGGGPRQPDQPRATRDLAAGDQFLAANLGHSSVRISTVSPIRANRTNGAQAARSGG